MTRLPEAFLVRMKNFLQTDYEEFIESYQWPQTHGLRINTLKIKADEFLKRSPFSLVKIPWTEQGFYFDENDRPGKHPYHAASLYYIQEPSAMAVVEVLDPKPGERILDISAAPGGKSTHILSRMNHAGLLLANEIHPKRVKALVENIERFGARNALITNESPSRLSGAFPQFFDRILVDAPCSGEGMFRKNGEAIAEWSEENIRSCAIRQDAILTEAEKMLKPDGILVYSTCTFAPEENEGTISRFIDKYPYFEIKPVPESLESLFEKGRPEWMDLDQNASIQQTLRLWPHRIRGEGHYIAKLQKKGEVSAAKVKDMIWKPLQEAYNYYQTFVKENLKKEFDGPFHSFGNHLYLVPQSLPDLKGLKVERLGFHLGELKKKRFEPGHALAMGLFADDVKRYIDLSDQPSLIEAYLKGESFQVDSPDSGWTLVTVHRFPLGWGKISGGILKNHLPKGLRWN